MSIELDAEAVRSFVTFRHMSLPPRRDVPPRADPLEVGRQASRLAVTVLGGLCDGDQCRVAECSGLLIYAMDGYGLNYEEVCQLACRKVAEVLRQITPDHRQTDPMRHLALRSAIGQADAFTLAVKLAEIRAVIARIPAEYDRPTMAARALDLKNWADRTHHLLEAMKALKELPRMQPALARAQDRLGNLAKFIDQAKAQERAAVAVARASAPAAAEKRPRARRGLHAFA